METVPVIHFGKLPAAALGIVAGGLLLGAGLASLANPSPKTRPAPVWAGSGEPRIGGGETAVSYQTYPQDLSPPNLAGGYAPAVAFSQMRSPADPPMPRFDDSWNRRWDDARRAAAADRALPADALPADALPADRGTAERAVPHYASLEKAAAARALPSQTAQNDSAPPLLDAGADPASVRTSGDLADPPPLPAGRARVIHIADAGE